MKTPCPVTADRLAALTKKHAATIKAGIAHNDDIALEVASNTGRYISDVDIVTLFRSVEKCDVAGIIQKIIELRDASINRIAEDKAEIDLGKEEEAKLKGQIVECLRQHRELTISDLSKRLIESPSHIRDMLVELQKECIVTLEWSSVSGKFGVMDVTRVWRLLTDEEADKKRNRVSVPPPSQEVMDYTFAIWRAA